MSARAFFSANAALHQRALETQLEAIERVAKLMAQTIWQPYGLVHLFGAGHSSLVGQEMFPRIGSVGGFNPIVDLPLTRFTAFAGDDVTRRRNLFLSTNEKYGAILAKDADFRAGDVVQRLGGRPDAMPSIFYKGKTGAERREAAAVVYERMSGDARRRKARP